MPLLIFSPGRLKYLDRLILRYLSRGGRLWRQTVYFQYIVQLVELIGERREEFLVLIQGIFTGERFQDGRVNHELIQRPAKSRLGI